MEYRVLGKTGLRISRLGFGGIPIQRIDADGTKALMHRLKEAGVNYIDTARGYTVSESYLGEALEGIREHFILATKSMSWTYDAMAKDIAISLSNLRTDHIELYQVHNPTVAQLEQVMAPGGALEALREAKAAGKIGHIGLTAHSLDVFKTALDFDWVETFMFPYNIVETQGEKLIAECAKRNIGFVDMKPLATSAFWLLKSTKVYVTFVLTILTPQKKIPNTLTLSKRTSSGSALNGMTASTLQATLISFMTVQSSSSKWARHSFVTLLPTR